MLRICTHFRPGMAACCADGGGVALLAAVRAEVARRGLGWRVEGSCCLGHCSVGPNVKAAPGGPMLHRCRSAADVLGRLPADWPPATEANDTEADAESAAEASLAGYPGC